MAPASLDTVVSGIYQLLWWASTPFLRYNHRLAEGYAQRCLARPHLSQADLWIQSASAGEAYLTWEILKQLAPDSPLRVLATTNTSQGMEILQQAATDISASNSNMEIQVSYFPFDSPAIMKQAVHLVQPRLMVLLETELWPGLLSCLKQAECRILLINGRLTPKSLSHYMIWPSFWRRRRPDKIYAISPKDRQRFCELFGSHAVTIMPNIKFDRLSSDNPSSQPLTDIAKGLPKHGKFLILGSVREAEEEDVEKIIQSILERQPDTVIGLFPRHMHRIDHWQKVLQGLGISWTLRSDTRLPNGGVVLWDVFGELSLAYPLASAAFVGGSLASQGGQNFLEPLVKGVPTVIGPFWENFKWVGVEILEKGILHQANTWKEVADFLVAGIINPPDREAVKKKAMTYIKTRQGGTAVACELIREYLRKGSEGDTRVGG
jgi:3-deoxy-D-manno-octulosonic-acid transferase